MKDSWNTIRAVNVLLISYVYIHMCICVCIYNIAAMKEANVYPYDNFAALDVMTIVPNLCFPRIRLVK